MPVAIFVANLNSGVCLQCLAPFIQGVFFYWFRPNSSKYGTVPYLELLGPNQSKKHPVSLLISSEECTRGSQVLTRFDKRFRILIAFEPNSITRARCFELLSFLIFWRNSFFKIFLQFCSTLTLKLSKFSEFFNNATLIVGSCILPYRAQ